MTSSRFEDIPSLETPSLVLRKPLEQDRAGIFADPAVMRYHDSEIYTEIEQASGWLERRAKAFADGRAIRWAITRKPDDVFLGPGRETKCPSDLPLENLPEMRISDFVAVDFDQ